MMKDAARDVGESHAEEGSPVCQGKEPGLDPTALGVTRTRGEQLPLGTVTADCPG